MTLASFCLEDDRLSRQLSETAASVVSLEETCLIFSGQLLLLVSQEGRVPPLLLKDDVFVLDLFDDVPQLQLKEREKKSLIT